MLKFINLKKLTAKTLVGILMVGGLLTPSGTRKATANSFQSCNNGHGNNAASTVYFTRSDGSEAYVTVEKFDPSNEKNWSKKYNKNKKQQLVDALKDKAQGSPFVIDYSGYDGSSLTTEEAQYVADNVEDLEKNCDSDGDGMNDADEGENDIDNDGLPNYKDLDSDGDGKLDSVEGTGDADGDGIANYLDSVNLVSAGSSDGNANGIEIHYYESALQCGADSTQANVKVNVYDQDNNLLTTMSKGDTFKTADVDSIEDLSFDYDIYNLSCISDGTNLTALGTELLAPGDTIPSVGGFSGQASIAQMLDGLNDYEELYLAELGSSNPSSSAYDLQDVVLVVNNDPVIVVEETTPESITLIGSVRDFKDSHPDFERSPGEGGFKYGLDKGITTSNLGGDLNPVYVGGSFSTTNKANFDQWYNDVPSVNMGKEYPITFNKQANGVYRYSSSNFFPIDNQLFGNQGRIHNYHFTYELHTRFTYNGGETFNFSGDDDVWVYINGKKVIDIGGVHSKIDASVDLDAVASEIGLEVGETYDLDFFFAERHTTQSNFTIETNLLLETNEDADADDDTDGLSDATEGKSENRDSDGDGDPDYIDEDSDDNGISDADEVKSDSGIPELKDSDNDGTPDYRDLDDDNNGIDDRDERIFDPSNPTKFLDTDGNGIPDFQDPDNDGDTIKDEDEGINKIVNGVDTSTNTDGKDAPDHLDKDSDNDSIEDEKEGAEDSDGDGTPDFRDVDSDNPNASTKEDIDDPNYVGLSDFDEGGELDTDGDGTPDSKNNDNDGDGIKDDDELIADFDGDGKPDTTDGEPDPDVDGDGELNPYDTDSNNDGTPDSPYNPDAPNNGISTYYDTYAD